MPVSPAAAKRLFSDPATIRVGMHTDTDMVTLPESVVWEARSALVIRQQRIYSYFGLDLLFDDDDGAFNRSLWLDCTVALAVVEAALDLPASTRTFEV